MSSTCTMYMHLFHFMEYLVIFPSKVTWRYDREWKFIIQDNLKQYRHHIQRSLEKKPTLFPPVIKHSPRLAVKVNFHYPFGDDTMAYYGTDML